MTSRFRAPVLLAVGLAAATLSYIGHHTPSLDGHVWSTAFFVIVGSAAAAAAISALAAAAPPAVVVARPAALSIRELRKTDLQHVARLHASALPHGFFASLGQRFLRAYDRTFAESPHAVAFVAEVDGHPVGFLLGVLEPSRHARYVRRRSARLAALGALGLIAHPRAGLRFARTRLRRYSRAWRRSAAVPARARHEPAVLSHVAVEPGARGAGAGRLLVRQFVDVAREAGTREARLLTLADDDGASAFYRELGWRMCGRRESADDAPAMNELALELEPRG